MALAQHRSSNLNLARQRRRRLQSGRLALLFSPVRILGANVTVNVSSNLALVSFNALGMQTPLNDNQNGN